MRYYLLVPLCYSCALFATPADSIRFSFNRTNIQAALAVIADMADLEPLIASDITGVVTVSVDGVALNHALSRFAQAAEIDVRIANNQLIATKKRPPANATTGLSPTIQPINKPEQLQKAVIHLRNVHTHYVQQALQAQGIRPSKKGGMILNKDTNSILLWDEAKHFRTLASAIRFLDTTERNIDITATIFIANQSTAQSLGARWGGRIEGSGWQLTGGSAGSLASDTFTSLGNAPMVTFDAGQTPTCNNNARVGLWQLIA